MARTASLSGFPEWLPEERAIETYFLEQLSRVFTLHGFSNIETRAVEPIGEIAQKGDIDKEIYVLSRFHDDGAAKKDQLALHFDLTVPFARYVKDNAGHLHFPFKRFQMQKVWRGERPQDGRFREFTQVDIDIVNEAELPLSADVQLLKTIVEAMKSLPMPDFTLRVNNRKICDGFYQLVGIKNTAEVLQIVDKLEKIGATKVAELIVHTGATSEQAEAALALATIRSQNAAEAVHRAKELAKKYTTASASEEAQSIFETGCSELQELLESVGATQLEADMSIARGLDYYTGSVFETALHGFEELGSICSGGRYDSLVKSGKKTYPGVGISIGLSRVLSKLIGEGMLTMSRKHPAVVYIALNNENERAQVAEVAQGLRARGIAAEEGSKPAKFGKQIKTADQLGIPFVWFMQEHGTHQVKDIRNGEQTETTVDSWQPAEEDLQAHVVTHFN